MLWRAGDRIIFEYDFANVTVIPIHSESDINRDIELAIRDWDDVPHIQQVFKSDFEEYLIESAIDRQLERERLLESGSIIANRLAGFGKPYEGQFRHIEDEFVPATIETQNRLLVEGIIRVGLTDRFDDA